jgi:RNA polymerase sigma-70 factor, ECF subfamily
MPVEYEMAADGELALQVQSGSLEAFEELVRRYEGRLYRFVLNCCRRETDAREITQDTFVRAYQAISKFDDRRPFGPWLFAIARRKHLDHLRAGLPVADEPVPEPTDGDDPAQIVARAEERDNLWLLARRNLPEIQFQALWLRYAEDMSVAEIARVLHKTETHAKVLMFRARRALAAVLPAEDSASSLAGEAPRRESRAGAETALSSESRSRLQPPGWSAAR